MARLPDGLVNRIQKQTKIEDVVGQYLHLNKSGKNLFAHCPFHTDVIPSFSVSPSKQIFHCFSCGRGGDVFRFLMEYKHLSFPEAVMKVARFDGINLSKQYLNTKPQKTIDPKTKALLMIYQEATKMYHYILTDTKIGEPALDYLHRRGLNDHTINAYQLGFAPDKNVLKQLLVNKQVKPELLRESGMFSEGKDHELHDRFFNRVMYPIKNEHGKVIAFSGRVLNKKASPAKYLNSPETALFHKREVIFNLDVAKAALQQTHALILYEGYMDVMSAFQSGVKNGIASMGTSLTNQQIQIISHLTHHVFVCYDGDTPGQRAINRALGILKNTNLNVGVIQMPAGIDPDEYRQKFGETRFKQYMNSAQETPAAFKLRFYKNGLDLESDQDKLTYVKKAVQVIAEINQPLTRDVYLKRLAKLVDLPIRDLQNQVRQLIASQQVQARPKYHRFSRSYRQHSYPNHAVSIAPPVTKPKSQVEIAEQHLFYRMLTDHTVWLNVTSVKDFHFVDIKYQTLMGIAEAYLKAHNQKYNPQAFEKFAEKGHLGSLVHQINQIQLPSVINGSEIADCVKIIMSAAPLSKQLKEKENALNEAARLKDVPQEQTLLKDIINIKRKLMKSKQRPNA